MISDDIKHLKSKTLLAIGGRSFVTRELKAFCTSIGMTQLEHRSALPLDIERYDGIVIDASLDADFLFTRADDLEHVHVPYVFAVNQMSGPGAPSRYALVPDLAELGRIAKALFAYTH